MTDGLAIGTKDGPLTFGEMGSAFRVVTPKRPREVIRQPKVGPGLLKKPFQASLLPAGVLQCLVLKNMDLLTGLDVVQSRCPIFDDFFQHLWPYIGNNTANVVFQMVKRLWLIRIDQ
ncbi:hypothetical protein TNCV_4385791 [Trichonephila clavipes]|nr:hypothetical protein TNCV_4385791 [Trichonephila clavipes]